MLMTIKCSEDFLDSLIDTFVILHDFATDYSFILQNKHEYHQNNTQVIIHPFVIYF